MPQKPLKEYLLFKMTVIKSDIREIKGDFNISGKLLPIQKFGQEKL